MQTRRLLHTLLSGLTAVAFSVTTVFLAPLPLLVLRRKEGRLALLAAALAGTVALYFLAPLVVAMSFGAAAILTVVLTECENSNIGYTASIFVTVIVLAGVGFLLGSFAVHYLGFQPIVFFKEQIAQTLTQLKVTPEVTQDQDSVLKQVPSAIVMMTIFSVWLNSILAPRVEKILGWAPEKLSHHFSSQELLEWKLPDAFVWIALASAAGNFLDFEPLWLKWTCTNVFNVVIMLYFFQGLAVVVNFFNTKRVGPIWRMISYILIFTQFWAVASLGFIDLWMQFRTRKKTDKRTAI